MLDPRSISEGTILTPNCLRLALVRGFEYHSRFLKRNYPNERRLYLRSAASFPHEVTIHDLYLALEFLRIELIAS